MAKFLAGVGLVASLAGFGALAISPYELAVSASSASRGGRIELAAGELSLSYAAGVSALSGKLVFGPCAQFEETVEMGEWRGRELVKITLVTEEISDGFFCLKAWGGRENVRILMHSSPTAWYIIELDGEIIFVGPLPAESPDLA